MTIAAPAAARRLADAFEDAGVPYAIGGALALGAWGFPRATSDVDVDVFVPVEHLNPVLDLLVEIGCEVDRAECMRRAAERGDFRVRLEGLRVDCFVPSIPLYDAAARRIRQAPLEGGPAWYLSPEDLATFKMLFFRTKDLLDVERLVAISAGAFDAGYVRKWLVDLVGENDDRVRRWDRLVQDVATLDSTSRE
jgi:hypothetical protein